MSHQNHAASIAKMIEQMIDIKLRAHDRKHHFKGTDEQFRSNANDSLVDQQELRAIQINLVDTIGKLLSS